MVSKKIGTVAVGYGAWQALTMVRVFALAMILPTAEFGLIAAITIIVLFSETGIDPRWDNFLIKANRAEQVSYQGTIQTLYLFKGIIVSALLFLTAGISSTLFQAKDHVSSFQIIAIIPIISGFMHTDYRRQQSDNNFRPEILMLVIGEIACILVALPLAYALGTHVAGVAGLVARTTTMTIVTHVTSQEKYRLEFDRSKIPTLFSYGTPLVFNSVIMYASGQIDRVTVGIFTDPAKLGIYSLLLQVISAPAAVLMRALGNIALPMLTAARSDADRDKKAQALVENGFVGVGFLFALLAILFVSDVIGLVLGARYKPEPMLVLVVALAAAFRIMRVWPTEVALSRQKTRLVLNNTMVRAAVVPLSVLAGYSGLGLVAVSGVMLLGETASFIASVMGLGRRDRDEVFLTWRNIALSVAVLALAGFFIVEVDGGIVGILIKILMSGILLAVAGRHILWSYRAYAS